MPLKLTARRVSKAVNDGFTRVRRVKSARIKFLRAYASRHHSNSGSDKGKADPLNLIFQATQTLVPNLVYNDPKAGITSKFLDYKPYAETLALAANHAAVEIRLREALRKVITDSIFLFGIMKSGIAAGDQVVWTGNEYTDVGQVYSERVDADDYVLDPMARDRDEAWVEGNKFRIPKKIALESGIVDKPMAERLSANYSFPFQPNKHASQITGEPKATWSDANELVEFIDLVELYLPKDRRLVTIPFDPSGGTTDVYLKDVEYEGPEAGPYDMLGFAYIPDNPFPVAPAMVWYDLHEAINKVVRKQMRQAERQKTVLAYEGTAWEDAQDIVDSDDGDSVRVDNVDAVKEINFGGANDDGYKYVEWAQGKFSEMAMNIDLLSGSGTSEPTATQSELVSANSSIRLADMQNMVYDFTAQIFKKITFYLHTDPMIELPLIKRTQGVEEQVFYTPEMREGDWLDYNITVIPFSMARADPNVKVRRMLEFFSSVIPALASAAQMLGPALNLEQAITIMGREMAIENLDEIINSQVLGQQTQRLMQLLEAGVPLDPKVIKSMMNPLVEQTEELGQAGVDLMGQGANMGMPGGARPQQPNPGGNMAGGITPSTEQNQIHQERAGELQGAYR
jgi:hypothetical protein